MKKPQEFVIVRSFIILNSSIKLFCFCFCFKYHWSCIFARVSKCICYVANNTFVRTITDISPIYGMKDWIRRWYERNIMSRIYHNLKKKKSVWRQAKAFQGWHDLNTIWWHNNIRNTHMLLATTQCLSVIERCSFMRERENDWKKRYQSKRYGNTWNIFVFLKSVVELCVFVFFTLRSFFSWPPLNVTYEHLLQASTY